MEWIDQPRGLLPDPEREITSEEKDEVWKRRASHLAQVITPEEEGEQFQLLILRMGNDLFGIDARCVFDIRLAPGESRELSFKWGVEGSPAG